LLHQPTTSVIDFDLNFILSKKPLSKLHVKAKCEKMISQFQHNEQLLNDCITRCEVTHLDSLSNFDDFVTKKRFSLKLHGNDSLIFNKLRSE
jgi:hypothetical protein